MSIELAQGLWAVLAAYAGAGLVFALAFVARGMQRIDPAAKGMPITARLLLLPGATLLWPLMLVQWLRQAPPPHA